MLDNHALRVFLEAARTENFTEAARILNLSQPAVSMQIKSLEDYLQVRLFEREGRRIRLTKVGQELLPMAREIVALSVSAEETIRASTGKVVGNLTIGCGAPAAKYILPHLVSRFQRTYPNVRVNIPMVAEEEVAEGLMRGTYDLGVCYSPEINGLVYTDFFIDHLALVVPTTHPWAQKGVIEPAQLFDEHFICHSQDSPCRRAVGESMARLGLDMGHLQLVMEIDSPEALAMSVEYGIGLSFVSIVTVAPRLPLGRLAIVRVEGMQVSMPVYLAHYPARPASPVQARFTEFMQHPQTRALIAAHAQGHMV
ncbi:MAG: LysR family transcriptional regulator [Anaerolineae bacterium]